MTWNWRDRVNRIGTGIVAASLAGCGGGATTQHVANETGTGQRATHSPSPQASGGSHACYFRATYARGSVLLEFIKPYSECATVVDAVRRLGPPFDGQLTALSHLDTTATYTCLKSKFYSEVMVVFPDVGESDVAIAFCTRLIGHGPPSPSQVT
jgi:hypothetical protein